MSKSNLCVLYEIASRKPGWLSKLTAVFGLNEEEVGFLEWLDEQESKLKKRLAEMEKSLRREGFDEALMDCESDDERLAVLNRLIFTIEDMHRIMLEMDKPWLDRAIHLLVSRYDHWVSLRKKIRSRMLHAAGAPASITDHDIEVARSVPFERLTEVKKKYIKCLWHEDTNESMWVENNFGWCFVCNSWADTIKWAMKKHNLKFQEAVKMLSRIA